MEEKYYEQKVRIYPLNSFQYGRYAHMERLMEDVETDGAKAVFPPSFLPFLPSSTQFLQLRKAL